MTDDQTMLARAAAVSPGASQTLSKAPGRVGPADRRAGFPLFARSGASAVLVGLDGKAYLDFAGANAAVPLGHARPAVVTAVTEAVERGALLSLPSALEVEVSETFCRLMQVEQVRWVKTGSEALAAAVRIARAATGATTVLVALHAYHGWHDWTKAAVAGYDPDRWDPDPVLTTGVPTVLTPTVRVYDYRVPETARDIVGELTRAGQRVAAIVVEPHRFWQDDAGQRAALAALRKLATQAGAVLILDELVYGLRWALRGAREYFGVDADLACYGKALGNGVPVACVCGTRDYMARAEQAGISGTYGGDRLGLAAAGAVLAIYEAEGIVETLWSRGRLFFETFRAACRARASRSPLGLGQDLVVTNLCVRPEGYPVHWTFSARSPELLDDVLTRCARAGVLFHRAANNASAAMTEDDVRMAATVLAEASVTAAEEQVSRV